MQIKRVWFVSHYSMPPEYEMRIKTQMYAHYLGLKGIDCTIFSASTIHNTDVNLIEGREDFIECTYGDLKFVHIKCDSYKGNGYARIKNMMQFATRFVKIAKRFELPDVIVADVNCINYEKIYQFCKRHSIPMYVDMRDLWPDSIVEYLHFSKNNPIIRYLYHKERIMYQRVNGIIFSMEGGKQYIQDKNWNIDTNKVYYINNGVDIEKFNSDIAEHRIEDPDLNNPELFKVIYTGSIRMANNIRVLVEAAKLLLESGVVILVYGDGDQKAPLEEYCKSNGITNIVFKGRVDKQFIPYILSRGDISVLNYQKANTWKYGGSQNKLFEYLAVGHPVLSTITMNYNLIERYNCGITLDNPNPKQIAEAILRLKRMSPEDFKRMGENAKQVAQGFDYSELAERLFSIINNDLKKSEINK